jgi:hypothetical protein
MGGFSVEVKSWYKNGDINAFHNFCTQNRKKLVSVIMNDSSIVKGILFDHHLGSIETAGVFILLTTRKIHPAFYALSDINSLHYLASAELIKTGSVVPSTHSISSNGLTFML